MNCIKKGIALIAAVLLTFSLNGCTKKDSETSSKETTNKSTSTKESSSKTTKATDKASNKTDENSKDNSGKDDDDSKENPIETSDGSEENNEQTEIPYDSYSNDKFAFTIDYPDIYSEKNESDNGDGISMESSDGAYTLKIYGAYNVNDSTGEDLLAEAKERVSHITDDFSSDIFYCIDYSDDGGKDGQEHIFHECGFILQGKILGYVISYPVEEEVVFNQIINIMTDDLVKDYDYDAFTPEEYEFYPLIEALCISQTQHYDSFKSDPDEITTTLTLYGLVTHNDFPWKDVLPLADGAYYFSAGPESEDSDPGDNVYVSPNELYQQYFANGKYKYPPEDLSYISEGTQTGIAIYTSDRPYGVYVEVFDYGEENDKVELSVNIYRLFNDESHSDPLGNAIITLKKDSSGYFGYKILSFEPKYPKFDDL